MCKPHTRRGDDLLPLQHPKREVPLEEVQVPPCVWHLFFRQTCNATVHGQDPQRPSSGYNRDCLMHL